MLPRRLTKRRPYPKHSFNLAERRTLMEKLEVKLQKRAFFENLNRHGSDKIKIIEIEDKKVAIKDTLGKASHGHDYEQIRKSLAEYKRALRSGSIKPEKHNLIHPRVFGKIGRYLVMEYVEGEALEQLKRRLSDQKLKSLTDAEQELYQNFCDVPGPWPKGQTLDRWVAGNTNPENPEKGKWLFVLPYDLA